MTDEEREAVIAALKAGSAIVCYAKCTPCDFGACPGRPHTWMEKGDLKHEGRPTPKSRQEWAELAKEKPCGCHCMRGAK